MVMQMSGNANEFYNKNSQENGPGQIQFSSKEFTSLL